MTRQMIAETTPGSAPSHSPPDLPYEPTQSTATCLGYFSIGLGLAEIFAHRQVARMIGIREYPRVLPLLGLREIASGIGLLCAKRPTSWLWSRAAGDAMDLAFLAAAEPRPDGGHRKYCAMGAVTLIAAVDAISSSMSTVAGRLENSSNKYFESEPSLPLANELPVPATEELQAVEVTS